MLIVVWISGGYSEPCQTSKMNLFAKIINDYKDKFKTLSNIWDRAFPPAVDRYRDKFRILPSISDGAFVFIDYD